MTTDSDSLFIGCIAVFFKDRSSLHSCFSQPEFKLRLSHELKSFIIRSPQLPWKLAICCVNTAGSVAEQATVPVDGRADGLAADLIHELQECHSWLRLSAVPSPLAQRHRSTLLHLSSVVILASSDEPQSPHSSRVTHHALLEERQRCSLPCHHTLQLIVSRESVACHRGSRPGSCSTLQPPSRSWRQPLAPALDDDPCDPSLLLSPLLAAQRRWLSEQAALQQRWASWSHQHAVRCSVRGQRSAMAAFWSQQEAQHQQQHIDRRLSARAPALALGLPLLLALIPSLRGYPWLVLALLAAAALLLLKDPLPPRVLAAWCLAELLWVQDLSHRFALVHECEVVGQSLVPDLPRSSGRLPLPAIHWLHGHSTLQQTQQDLLQQLQSHWLALLLQGPAQPWGKPELSDALCLVQRHQQAVQALLTGRAIRDPFLSSCLISLMLVLLWSLLASSAPLSANPLLLGLTILCLALWLRHGPLAVTQYRLRRHKTEIDQVWRELRRALDASDLEHPDQRTHLRAQVLAICNKMADLVHDAFEASRWR